MTDTIADRLRRLGHQLPEASGPAVGRLGAELTVEQGQAAAAAAALSLLAQIDRLVEGDVARVKRIARLGIFVAATADFTQHPLVGNGASDLIVAVLGEAGRHARTTVGVASLPRGAAVEVDAIVELAG